MFPSLNHQTPAFFQAPGEAPWLPRGALGRRSRPGAAGRFGLRGALRRHGAATGGVSSGGTAGGAKGQGKDGGTPAVLHGAGDDLLPDLLMILKFGIFGIGMGEIDWNLGRLRDKALRFFKDKVHMCT